MKILICTIILSPFYNSPKNSKSSSYQKTIPPLQRHEISKLSKLEKIPWDIQEDTAVWKW